MLLLVILWNKVLKHSSCFVFSYFYLRLIDLYASSLGMYICDYNCPKHPKLLLQSYCNFIQVIMFRKLHLGPYATFCEGSHSVPAQSGALCAHRMYLSARQKVPECLCGLRGTAQCPWLRVATEPFREQHIVHHKISATPQVWRRLLHCWLTHI